MINDFDTLTEREKEVLELVAKGYNNVQIGKELFISRHTAKSHVCSILRKLSVSNKTQVAMKAYQEGYLKKIS